MSDLQELRERYQVILDDNPSEWLTLRAHYALEAAENIIAELGALAAKWKWQRDEAIADGPGYFPKDTLERRWAERATR